MKKWWVAAWLASGTAVLLHDAMTGGGIAGYLLFREIIDFGATEPSFTYIGLGIPLFLVPVIILSPRRRRRRLAEDWPVAPATRRAIRCISVAAAGALAAVAALAVVRAASVPGGDAPVVRVALDATPAEAVPDGARVILRGTARTGYSVAFDEVTHSRHGPNIHEAHDFVPMTQTDWTPDQPVSFISDLGGANALPGPPPLAWTKYQDTAPGVLLNDAVPAYLVRAFSAHGITLAPGARLHTTKTVDVVMAWLAIAGFAGFCAIASLVGGFSIR